MTALLPVALAVAAVWALALASHLAGNPTAINAVVGIPMGAALAGALALSIKLADRNDKEKNR